jgi:hypothetical protein
MSEERRARSENEIASSANMISFFAMTVVILSLRVLLPAILMRSNLIFPRLAELALRYAGTAFLCVSVAFDPKTL